MEALGGSTTRHACPCSSQLKHACTVCLSNNAPPCLHVFLASLLQLERSQAACPSSIPSPPTCRASILMGHVEGVTKAGAHHSKTMRIAPRSLEGPRRRGIAGASITMHAIATIPLRGGPCIGASMQAWRHAGMSMAHGTTTAATGMEACGHGGMRAWPSHCSYNQTTISPS